MSGLGIGLGVCRRFEASELGRLGRRDFFDRREELASGQHGAV